MFGICGIVVGLGTAHVIVTGLATYHSSLVIDPISPFGHWPVPFDVPVIVSVTWCAVIPKICRVVGSFTVLTVIVTPPLPWIGDPDGFGWLGGGEYCFISCCALATEAAIAALYWSNVITQYVFLLLSALMMRLVSHCSICVPFSLSERMRCGPMIVVSLVGLGWKNMAAGPPIFVVVVVVHVSCVGVAPLANSGMAAAPTAATPAANAKKRVRDARCIMRFLRRMEMPKASRGYARHAVRSANARRRPRARAAC